MNGMGGMGGAASSETGLRIENANAHGYPLRVVRGRFGGATLSLGEAPCPVVSIDLCGAEVRRLAAYMTEGDR